ncbi:MAG: S8 family serine peptidase, partial [Eubacterium sp.]|nr:S8 family serine peptidase [Eubacterium sp.]
LKWLDEDGSGFTEDVLATYDYVNRALDLGENVIAISNSWGGEGPKEEIDAFTEIFDKFGERGVVSLVAAGNEATDISEGRTEVDSIFGKIELDEPVFTTPASCDSPYQLTVAATNERDELAGFSNYSKTKVDVAAPGTDILSTVCTDCFNPSIYSSEKKAALVAEMQDYEGTVSPSDFGYPKPLAISHEDSEEYFSVDFSTNVTIAQTDKHFGDSGKSITLTTQDEIEQPEDEDETNALLYCFEVPYTVPDENKNYAVSFMTASNKDSFVLAADVPADYEVKDHFEDIIMTYSVAQTGGSNGGSYWSHMSYIVNPEDKWLKKGADRKIVFLTEAYEKGTEFTFDDFAISVQDVDTAEFEKYDFYNGTSMATPYVAGAVALIKNAYPDATARDVVNMVKNTGRYVEGLKEQVETARVISLENPENIPPMIFNAGYNEKGQITIDGSFKDVTTVKVNGTEVTPASSGNNEIVVADKNYSTNKITVEVENAIGKDEYTGLVSNKKLIELSKEVEGEPFGITDGS